VQNLLVAAKYSLILPLVVTVCFLVNFFTGGVLTPFGLVPRQPDHLVGIITTLFVHRELNHFLSNIAPLIVFSFLLVQHGFKRYLIVVSTLVLMVGVGVWILGRPHNHIGASGLIYGLFAYLLCHGLYERSVKAVAISVVVFVLYFGMALSAFRLSTSISWESHILGVIAGIVVAKKLHLKKL